MDYGEEYGRLLDSQVFCPAELDYSVLARHAGQLSTMAEVANSGISVFDMYRRNHPFVSRNFGRLFKYDLSRIDAGDAKYFNLQIHPDDFPAVMRTGVIGLRFVLENRSVVLDTKLVCEYRINVSGRWVRGIEQMQVLEIDPRGNIWLALSVLDLSPNQTPLECVEAKLYNFKTGEIFPLPDYPEYEGGSRRADLSGETGAEVGARRFSEQGDFRAVENQRSYGQYVQTVDYRKAERQ